MSDKYCVCGAKVCVNTGGYDCPRCFRHYNINGKLIGNNHMIEFCENAKRQDIKTMHYDNEAEVTNDES